MILQMSGNDLRLGECGGNLAIFNLETTNVQ